MNFKRLKYIISTFIVILCSAAYPIYNVNASEEDRESSLKAKKYSQVAAMLSRSFDYDTALRKKIIAVIQDKGEADPLVLELLSGALKHPDSRVRADVAHIFQYMHDPRVVEPLITALKDPDPEVRKFASNSLYTKHDRRAVEPLILALNDHDARVRRNAAAGLEYKDDPRVVEPLIAALKDSDPEVRRIAGAVLGDIEDPRAFEPLVALLDDGNSVVREWVSEKLIKIEDPRVFEPIIAALKNNEPMMRQNAASILEKKKEDRRLIQPLIDAMKDSDPIVQQSAAYTLAYIKNQYAAELLINALKDKDAEVVRLSLLALLVKEREDPRVAAALRDADPPVKKLISNSLKKKGTGYKCSVTGMDLVFVKGGCYKMGDIFSSGYSHEKPVHTVCVNNFYMGKYEITQGQWEKVMGSNPSHFSNISNHNPGENCKNISDNCPVENVSWNEVQVFIRKLNFLSGKNYRLPTEAEWEYAARSGGKKQKWSGTDKKTALADYAWIADNTNAETYPVGKKKPNGLGIYDMTGNVAEWCSDWLASDYYKVSPRDNPKGPDSGSTDDEEGGNPPYRVVRGGHWNTNVDHLRVTMRGGHIPDEGSDTIGFRIVLVTP